MEEIDQAEDQGKIKDDKWESKRYIEQCKGDTVKDIIKIRLHMQDLKNNYKKEEEQPLCPLCEIEKDTTEHALRCGRDTDRKQRNIKNNKDEECEEVVQTYRENKRKRKERREKVQEESFRSGCLVQP